MILSFHKKLLEFLTLYKTSIEYLLPASILSFYLYDPGSLLANITRRKLKVNRVSNIDEGFRVLMNLSLNASFRKIMKEAFLDVLSRTEAVSELIVLARSGAINIILHGLEKLRSEYRDNPALNYALSEIKRIMKSNKITILKPEITSLKAIITFFFAPPATPGAIFGSIGKSLGTHEVGAELWQINLEGDVIKDVEFLVYALNVTELPKDLLTNLLNKCKIAILMYDKYFVRKYGDIETFFNIFGEHLKKLECIGILSENQSAVDVSRDLLTEFSNTYFFYSENVMDLLYNCTVRLLKYLEKKRS